MHDLIRTEGPALLGYAALAVILGLGVLVTYLASEDARAMRRHNRRVRHARAGCSVCRQQLETTTITATAITAITIDEEPTA